MSRPFPFSVSIVTDGALRVHVRDEHRVDGLGRLHTTIHVSLAPPAPAPAVEPPAPVAPRLGLTLARLWLALRGRRA